MFKELSQEKKSLDVKIVSQYYLMVMKKNKLPFLDQN